MKVLQISTVCGSGSVGRIIVDIYHTLEQGGDQCLIAYGRQKAPEGLNAFRFGTDMDMAFHVLSTFFKGEHGFASAGQTKRLIRKIREWDPDVIHLHNIHGFVLQTELLFDYLKQSGKPVVWTLHDCWPYTGHCAFYDYNSCEGWKSGCKDCREYRRTYPYALFRDHTAENYRRKRAAFTGVPNLTIVTPSRWLAGEVRQSFLKEYPVEVIANGIDLSKFRPTGRKLCRREDLKDKYLILGVANVWERRKGLKYFAELAGRLPDDCRILLVGLKPRQARKERLPGSILPLGRITRIEGEDGLAACYSAADVYVNPTLEDNFPTTNLEALACGTPVVTFQTGGSPESLDESCGRVVKKGDADALLEAVLEERRSPRKAEDCRRRAEQYDKYDRFREYTALYRRVCGQGE